MPERCVAAGYNNTRNVEERISLHVIPFYGDERKEAKKRRKRWTDFVEQKRVKWTASKRSVACSEHFTADDFTHRYANLDVEEEGKQLPIANRWLKRDDLGITVLPTVHTAREQQRPTTDRDMRMVRYYITLDCCCELLY